MLSNIEGGFTLDPDGKLANIFDAGFPPKFIPSFSWGGKNGFVTHEIKKAIEVAKVVMKRRNVELDKKTIEIYKHIFHQIAQGAREYRVASSSFQVPNTCPV